MPQALTIWVATATADVVVVVVMLVVVWTKVVDAGRRKPLARAPTEEEADRARLARRVARWSRHGRRCQSGEGDGRGEEGAPEHFEKQREAWSLKKSDWAENEG